MDEARAVIRRLERIEALDRNSAPAGVLLAEGRALLEEAEAWVQVEPSGTGAAEDALGRCRSALGAPEAAASALGGLW